jgi:hypothetical protein
MTDFTLGGACPKCGGDMKVIDGTYNITNGVVTAFRALDAAQLRDMQTVLRDSRAGKLTAEAATEQAAAISPDMAALVAALQQQSRWSSAVIVQTLLAALAVVLAWMALHQASTLTDADHKVLQRDIQNAIQQIDPKPSPGVPVLRDRSSVAPDQSAPKAKTKPRKKRPSKTYGSHKRHRR